MALKDYFSGVKFLVWDEMFDCRQSMDRIWKSYCVLQFDEDGPLVYSFGDSPTGRLKRIDSACAWVTYPGPRFRFGSQPGTSRTHRYVAFTGPKVQRYINTGLIVTGSHPPMYEISRPGRFTADMRELFRCLGKRLRHVSKVTYPLDETVDIPNLPRAVNLLEGLLLRMHESVSQELPDRWATAMADLIHRINLTPDAEWDFHAEAKRMDISYGHFRHMFSAHIGMSPGKFVQNARMDLAAQMLRVTNKSIAEVAESVQIDDIYYFSKLFKRHHNIPPGRYRRDVGHRPLKSKQSDN